MENFGFVMATKMLVDNKRKVRFMYREEPSNDQDSGWRFFCGDEDQDYTDNPDNIAIYNVNTIIAIDKSIMPYLNSIKGTALEREDENGVFTISEDFEFGEEGK
ncbi:MAG: DUF2185 domain-containing protein [Treponema sp.]|jgi:hypothetical protein|nr:DUF2185 domain-containing protein [Treponema sp.]